MDQNGSSGGGRYDGLGLYHDRNDPRIFVPKQNWIMGWTINVEHRFGAAVLWAIGVGTVIAIFLGVPSTFDRLR